MNRIVFFDLEISGKKRTKDIGAITYTNAIFSGHDLSEFYDFIKKYSFIAGHNIFEHDLQYISKPNKMIAIDTLLWSPLLYPKKPYHRLLKNDKWSETDSNDPVNDAKKSMDLFFELVDKFNQLDENMKIILYELLGKDKRYDGFFKYLKYRKSTWNLIKTIRDYFKGFICENADIKEIIKDNPIELAYALSIIKYTNDSILPPWVNYRYPKTQNILHRLRNINCGSCDYCQTNLNEQKALNDFFGYEDFRKFSGRDIQREAVRDAINDESLLVVFPTGGGKSLTFQLPALIEGRSIGGLTVVISPLQALMKDQIDNLEKKHSITSAITINGLLSPIERKKAYQYLEDGTAHILYISPEMLRSRSIETMLKKRNVVRFVIDEAHCFSTWGQDFRIDYQYIGKFIKKLNEYEQKSIPVSCFTATAKPQVIDDIKSYFNKHLDIEFKEHIYSGSRENLSYHVRMVKDERDRYEKLRNILEESKEPTIIYVSRTQLAEDLSNKLTEDGYPSTYFHGQLEREDKKNNQDKFMSGEVNIIVATTAFGMGVDKDDVKNVIHYNISSSLENYIQEAGRAGRNQSMQAHCYILYNEDDLNVHFNLLNQSKLSIDEIKQIWQAIKRLTGKRKDLTISPLELAREAGWDEDEFDIDTKVKTAVNELERAEYLIRGQNNPSVYGTSLKVSNIQDAMRYIEKSPSLTEYGEEARKIISRMLTVKKTNRDDPIARVEYISIQLSMEKEQVIQIINWLAEVGVIEDNLDIKSYIGNDSQRKLSNKLATLFELENYLYEIIDNDVTIVNYKEIVEKFIDEDFKYKVNINQIIQLINYLVQEKYLDKGKSIRKHVYRYSWSKHVDIIKKEREKHYDLAYRILDFLYDEANKIRLENQKEVPVNFSLKDIQDYYKGDLFNEQTSYDTIQQVLHFLTKNRIIRVDGAFFVLYNTIRIKRLVEEQNIQYKKDDYKHLESHYKHKNEQIHIVGDYAKMLDEDYNKASQFVSDYFNLSFDKFLNKYYKDRKKQLEISQTQEKYNRIFNDLSEKQSEIIKDPSQYITVFAGPGSGKTRLLVHKLASLALLEDVKASQVLALTFSNAAAIEFKTRLINLIGDMGYFIKVSTFHSYCFELIEIEGTIEKSDRVVAEAAKKIMDDEVDLSKITRTMLVIDEAQDMSAAEFELIKALMIKNPDMRILAVGDSDQNIYEFRNSNSKYFESLNKDYGATFFELVTNYRSKKNLIWFTNRFVRRINDRIKKTPIQPINNENGTLEITEYSADDLVIPIVEDVISQKLKGTTAILTRENIQALNIYTQLTKKGINAKLLQTEVNYRLYDLLELRTFLSYFENNKRINEEEWSKGLNRFKKEFKESELLDSCLKLLYNFKEVYPTLYTSDLKQFLYESREEDFSVDEQTEIVVSTMHQSKGKEFDNVFIYNDFISLKQQDVRLLYVAMTRAKNNLYIHTKTDIFKKYNAFNLKYTIDNKNYESPDELVIPLNYEDVHLDKFISRQKLILNMRSSDKLEVGKTGLKAYGRLIVSFSNKFINLLNKRQAEGYDIESAQVKSIVYWYKKETEEENLIVLPIVTLKKKENEEVLEQLNLKQNFENLFIELQELRENLKTELRKPIDLIYKDNSIHDLIKKMPKDNDDLLSVYGFGPKKTKQFGKFILEIIDKYRELIKPGEYEYIRDSNENLPKLWTKEEEQQLIDEVSRGLTNSEIAKIHNRTIGGIRARRKRLVI
ncbi:MAG: RecQ family ATP-dependent DNA helicase [Acholeplasmataceae bacterium]